MVGCNFTYHHSFNSNIVTLSLQKAYRVILLSGTPALSKPQELFPQISAVDKKLFPKFHEFGVRYCDGKQVRIKWMICKLDKAPNILLFIIIITGIIQ